jgi:hypothetical protein
MGKAYRFEFDSENKVQLMRFEEKRATDELLVEVYAAIRRYAIATDADAGIADFSSVTQIDVSSEVIRHLAKQEPAMPHPTERPRIAVCRNDKGFNLLLMFQTLGKATRPLHLVVRTLDEALKALAVQSPKFELWDLP